MSKVLFFTVLLIGGANLLPAQDIGDLEKEQISLADSLINLGNSYYAKDNYAQSEKYYLDALAVFGTVLGIDHPDYATTLNGLGVLNSLMVNYYQAEKYYIKAKKIREKTLGKDHPDYANTLYSLGVTYYHTGNYYQAEK